MVESESCGNFDTVNEDAKQEQQAQTETRTTIFSPSTSAQIPKASLLRASASYIPPRSRIGLQDSLAIATATSYYNEGTEADHQFLAFSHSARDCDSAPPIRSKFGTFGSVACASLNWNFKKVWFKTFSLARHRNIFFRFTSSTVIVLILIPLPLHATSLEIRRSRRPIFHNEILVPKDAQILMFRHRFKIHRKKTHQRRNLFAYHIQVVSKIVMTTTKKSRFLQIALVLWISYPHQCQTCSKAQQRMNCHHNETIHHNLFPHLCPTLWMKIWFVKV